MRLAAKIKLSVLSATAFALSTSAVWAQDTSGARWWWRWFRRNGGGHSGGGHTGGGHSNAVPEIDAGAGLLAIAAVLATLALVWELRRRRKTQG